jgi:hypothetical protein
MVRALLYHKRVEIKILILNSPGRKMGFDSPPHIKQNLRIILYSGSLRIALLCGARFANHPRIEKHAIKTISPTILTTICKVRKERLFTTCALEKVTT